MATTNASNTNPSSTPTSPSTSTSTRVGYLQVFTREQNPTPSTTPSSPTAAPRSPPTTPPALAHSPALTEARSYLRPGDTLVVTKLDRLGRSVKNLKGLTAQLDTAGVGLRAISQGIDTTTPGGRLFFHMLAAIAEFEHDLVVERTREGLAAARSQGRRGGGVVKMTATKAAQARLMYDGGGHTVAQIAATFGVSHATIYRYLGTAHLKWG